MFVPAKNGLFVFRICGYLVRRRLLRCVIICVFGKQRVTSRTSVTRGAYPACLGPESDKFSCTLIRK